MKRRRLLAPLLAALAALAFSQAAYGATAYRVPILMIHHVRCPVAGWPNAGLFLCPSDLDKQMAKIKANGWQAITADQLVSYIEQGTCPGPKTFVITLDDGWRDGYIDGAPIFEKYGYRASYAMVTQKAGAGYDVDKPHFDWDEARDLIARGHDIINHTRLHTPVKNDSLALLDEEIGGAQDDIERELGYRPKVFVYPYGSMSYGGTDHAYVTEHFALGLTDPGSNGAVNGADETTDPAHAPRIRVVGGYHPTGPKALLRKMAQYGVPC